MTDNTGLKFLLVTINLPTGTAGRRRLQTERRLKAERTELKSFRSEK